jgi:prolyl oligopeptidase
MSKRNIKLKLITLFFASFFTLNSLANLHYPTPPTDSTVIIKHGVTVKDPYRPLEKTNNKKVKKWLMEEEKLTNYYFKNNKFFPVIKKQLTALIQFDKMQSPKYSGQRYFFLARKKGEQFYSLYITKNIMKPSEATLLFNPMKRDSDGTISISDFYPSFDGRYVLIKIRKNGADLQTFRIFGVSNKHFLKEEIKGIRYSGASWTPDSHGFYYTRYRSNEKKDIAKGNAVFYHKLHTSQQQDQKILPSIPKTKFSVETIKDSPFLFVNVGKNTLRGRSLLYRRIGNRSEKFKKLFPAYQEYISLIGNKGSTYYFFTRKNAPSGKIIKIDRGDSPITEKTVIPEIPKSPLEGWLLVNDKLIINRLVNASSQLSVYNLKTKKTTRLHLPPATMIDKITANKKGQTFFLRASSILSPDRIYSYNTNNFKRKLIFQSIVPGFIPSNYTIKQVWYKSKDGTSIPMFLAYRKNMIRNGKNPTLLYGYGGFGDSLSIHFLTHYAEWLKMGGILALPGIRGGGEFGKDWHNAARRLTKQNTFDDFASAMHYLIKEKYTNSSKLAIMGGSQGGLLVGVMLTQHPKLFKAAITQAGLFDMMRYHLAPISSDVIAEYGSPDNEKELHSLLAYSPLHNVKKGIHYPATLIITGDHDDRVLPYQSYKFLAALQQASASHLPILLKVLKNVGHGYGRTIKVRIDERASILSFLAQELNIRSWVHNQKQPLKVKRK